MTVQVFYLKKKAKFHTKYFANMFKRILWRDFQCFNIYILATILVTVTLWVPSPLFGNDLWKQLSCNDCNMFILWKFLIWIYWTIGMCVITFLAVMLLSLVHYFIYFFFLLVSTIIYCRIKGETESKYFNL